MATTPVVTVRLKPELRERLERLAKAQRRSRSFVATEAIREYVKANEGPRSTTRSARRPPGRPARVSERNPCSAPAWGGAIPTATRSPASWASLG